MTGERLPQQGSQILFFFFCYCHGIEYSFTFLGKMGGGQASILGMVKG